eukprot:scaffold180_cov311-Pinguiococcus_pyrenoidosus.AAC.2
MLPQSQMPSVRKRLISFPKIWGSPPSQDLERSFQNVCPPSALQDVNPLSTLSVPRNRSTRTGRSLGWPWRAQSSSGPVFG